ncbi:MAG: hypothetical protein HC908_01060 [Calothrix sp. SM1_7_51]|nr:hypothetical protein [Calothrix sp. SM1_7_51]
MRLVLRRRAKREAVYLRHKFRHKYIQPIHQNIGVGCMDTECDASNNSPIYIKGKSTKMAWQVSSTCPVNPIHAALLRTGKVLFLAGSGNDPNNFANSGTGFAVWNPQDGSFARPTIPNRPDGSPIDLFCTGHSFRSNGRLVIAGGTLEYDNATPTGYDPFKGDDVCFTFDPISESFRQIASMKEGRWYATVLTLGNGRIFAISGLDKEGRLSDQPEIYNASNNTWTIFTQPTRTVFLITVICF